MTSRVLVYNKSSIPDSELLTGLECDSRSFVTFDNKYFTVSVQLCFEKHVPVEEICDTVEAFVYVIDDQISEIQSAVNDLNEFQEFLSETDPAVKLLLINSDEPLHESELLEWCVEHQFELIKYIVPDNAPEDELMGHSEGITRVRSALECHSWPYLTMKDRKPASQRDSARQTDFVKQTDTVKPSDSVQQTDSLEDFGDYASGTDFQSLVEGDVLEGGDFQDMFSNMLKIKEVAEQMPDHEQRKRFAEQVAMSFWKAMGGSDDES